MANEEQVKLLKQGVEGWNKWRMELRNIGRGIDLSDTNLLEAKLMGANLFAVNLLGANLAGADLRNANLRSANLSQTNLRKTNFNKADLWKAKLVKANLRYTGLEGANLTEVSIGDTIFGETDLSNTKGLEHVFHYGPSLLGTSTLQLSKGKIPEKFLRGCGLSDWEIEAAKLYQPGLESKDVNDIGYRIYDLRATRAIQINHLFISYSHKDGAFVDEMEKKLDKRGIRFWRDIHDASAGPLEEIVDRAIQQNPIVLLVLSKNSVKSDWVEHEALTARKLEKKKAGRHVLCPVALDNAWKKSTWSAVLREQIEKYHILDFSKWKDGEEFAKVFRKMVEGLDLFYKEK